MFVLASGRSESGSVFVAVIQGFCLAVGGGGGGVRMFVLLTVQAQTNSKSLMCVLMERDRKEGRVRQL